MTRSPVHWGCHSPYGGRVGGLGSRRKVRGTACSPGVSFSRVLERINDLQYENEKTHPSIFFNYAVVIHVRSRENVNADGVQASSTVYSTVGNADGDDDGDDLPICDFM